MAIAILVSALLAFALGWLWYSPKLFGNTWHEAIGKPVGDPKESFAKYLVTFTGWLIAAFVYSFLISNPYIVGVRDYLFLSVALWGAYMMPAKAHAIMWGDFNTKLLWIDGGYMLLGYLIMGLVFGVMMPGISQ
ncbi:MAG TPA: DUF1761 domain-containing protein [Alphaproteobacteria bacterium]